MKKIPTLFVRNHDGNRLVRDEIVPGTEWVTAGEGIATRKMDGTCCMVRDGKLFKRYDAKRGKTPPPGFEPAQDYDELTGHMPGWIPVAGNNEDRWHREACGKTGNPDRVDLPDGTYELCGPKVQQNPEGYTKHVLLRHGCEVLHGCPRTFDALRIYLLDGLIEGVVWRGDDGRMVKIKGKDFGIKRK